ncbi:hypothetical protein [Spartinivicinus ruber]|uniref:hypothetical protein n=1 Tax=Spartinivicinus ruber TaxID=2683272 RepID=UPI0013D7F0C5|nr:hypothetical protein [Spartinivicinus ruber]
MVHKRLLFFWGSLLFTATCIASSPDAWDDFQTNVKSKCTESINLKDLKVNVDPFGTTSYGVAIFEGFYGSKAGKYQVKGICIMDKKSKAVETLNLSEELLTK